MKSHMSKLDDANRLLDAGQFSKARELFSALIVDVESAPLIKGRARLGEVRALIGLGNFEEAIDLIERIFEDKKQQVQPNLRPYFFHERARIADFQGNRHDAIAYYREELLHLSSSMPHYFRRLAENYIRQGTIFLELGERENCEIYLRLARDYADRVTSEKAYADMLTLKARCLEEDGELSKALNLLCEARDLYITDGLFYESATADKRIADVRCRMERG
ncbi:MAG: tetratricopeptide repeat protein [Saccharofermentanales bacterium]|jgi:tetratricopeptide (TPR) repeat protein